MKLKTLLICSLIAGVLGLSSAARADFFSSPFDWMDNDDDYRYDRGGRGYGQDRWRQYDEWEPNYWRYRYFDNDSNDNFFDEFDGDFFGDGRGDFNFDMNMGFDGNSRFDGDQNNDYRYRGDSRRNDPGRYYDDRQRYSGDYDRPDARYNERRRSTNDDRYNDDYWRNYSQQYDGGSRRFSDTPGRDPRR